MKNYLYILFVLFISMASMGCLKPSDNLSICASEQSTKIDRTAADSIFSEKYVVIDKRLDLSNNRIKLSPNTIISIEGGYLDNGILVGNNTVLNAPPSLVFGSRLKLEGTWVVKETYPQWYGAIANDDEDDTDAFTLLLQAIDETNLTNIFIPSGVYNIRHLEIKKNSTTICGDISSFWETGTCICGMAANNLIDIDAQRVVLKDIYIYTKIDQSKLKKYAAISVDNKKAKSGLSLTNISINGYGTGVYTNQCFLAKIEYCRAANCICGFSINNIGTSVELDKCWALYCNIGYSINECTYCKLNNCCSDNCDNGYMVRNSQGIEFSSCACEVSKGTPIISDNSKISVINFVSYRCNESLENNALIGYAHNSDISATGCIVSEGPKKMKANANPKEWTTSNSVMRNEYGGQDQKEISAKHTINNPKTLKGKTSSYGILDSALRLSDVEVINAACTSDINTIVLPFVSGDPLRWQFKIMNATSMEPIINKEVKINIYYK